MEILFIYNYDLPPECIFFTVNSYKPVKMKYFKCQLGLLLSLHRKLIFSSSFLTFLLQGLCHNNQFFQLTGKTKGIAALQLYVQVGYNKVQIFI